MDEQANPWQPLFVTDETTGKRLFRLARCRAIAASKKEAIRRYFLAIFQSDSKKSR